MTGLEGRRLLARLGVIAGATIVLWLPASMAAACALTDVTCVADEVVDDVADAVGSASDPVTSVTDDVVDETEERADDAAGTVTRVVDDLTGRVDPGPDPGDDPGPGPKGHEPRDGRDRSDRDTDRSGASRQRALERAFAPSGDRGGTFAELIPASVTRTDPNAHIAGSIGQALERVATVAFPLVLTLLVAAFVLIQHRIDARDPRLTLSPLGPDDLVFS